MRKRVTVSIEESLLDWVDDRTRDGTFRSRSHVFQWSLDTMKRAVDIWETTRAPITITLRKVP